jgi:hypothetical protein
MWWLQPWCKSWLTAAARRSRKASPRQRSARPTLEVLEGRSLPSSLTLAGLSPLTADIHAGAHSVPPLAMHTVRHPGGGGGPGDPPRGGL